jgi:putative flippase GtrA
MAKNKKPLKEVVQYAITGGAWFWSGYAMFAVCYSLLGLDIVPSKIISYLFGLAVNFILERFWVFNDRKARKELDTVTVRYVAISTVNLGIDTGIVWGLSKLGVSPYIGQFVSAGFFTIWNYVWYKLWVFARGATPKPKRAAAPALRRPKSARRRKGYANKRTKR